MNQYFTQSKDKSIAYFDDAKTTTTSGFDYSSRAEWLTRFLEEFNREHSKTKTGTKIIVKRYAIK